MKNCSLVPKLYKNYNLDRKSTRLNSSHSQISYAVFCLKKKNIPLVGPGERIVTCVGYDSRHDRIDNVFARFGPVTQNAIRREFTAPAASYLNPAHTTYS